MANEAQSEALRKRMDALGIRESDLEERFVLGSGAGGQKINKTHSCVHLTHRPTGLIVRCQWTRSRARNRELARGELCLQLEKRRDRQISATRAAVALHRRMNRRPSKATKRRRRAQKTRRSELKSSRRPPSLD